MPGILPQLVASGTIGILVAIALVILFFLASMPKAVSQPPSVRDNSLKLTRALPNGAATVYSTGLDTGVGPQGSQPANVEYLLSAPAMNATEMPDGKTMIYSILTDTVAPIDGSSTVLYPSVLTQTGAGGAGCAAATFRFKLPSTATRILGFRAVGSASGNATTASATLEAVF